MALALGASLGIPFAVPYVAGLIVPELGENPKYGLPGAYAVGACVCFISLVSAIIFIRLDKNMESHD